MRTLAHQPLGRQLLLATLIPAALLAIAVAAMFMLRAIQAADIAMRDRALAIAAFLAPSAEYGVQSGNRTTLDELLQAALAQRDVSAAAIYDLDGRLLSMSGRPRLTHAEHLQEVRDTRILDVGDTRLSVVAPVRTTALVIDDIPNAGRPSTTSEPAGWVYLEFDTEPLAADKRAMIQSTLLFTFTGLGLTALLARRLARSVVRPVERLAEGVSRLTRGERLVSVADDDAPAELRALAHGFDTMAQAIGDAQQSLQARVDEATARLAHQALHDPLTGLPNRRAFEQALEEAVHASRRANDHGVLCFIDLDRFKIVNDTCGHAAGDELLRGIAQLLRQRVRSEDLICRIGGDEFALLLRGCDLREGERIAGALREAIASHRFSWEDRRFTVGASIGLVSIDGSHESAADVTVAADLACYASKKGGRNRVTIHAGNAGQGMLPMQPAAPALGSGGIPFSRLELFLQPIEAVRQDAPQLPWVEVLIRIHDDAGLLQRPGSFLAHMDPASEGVRLDLWVAEQALQHLGSAPGAPDIGLNLCQRAIEDSDVYLDGLAGLLARLRIQPGRVVLEFPAQLAVRMPQETRRLAARSRALGCRFALEQLDGSSVGLLQALHPDFVKISLKTLVETYGLEAGCSLAQALCGACAALSVPAIASEVEDELFRNALRGYGFDFAQGHAISPPRPMLTS